MAPSFTNKDAALAHAMQLAQELQAAGFLVELVVESPGAMPDVSLEPATEGEKPSGAEGHAAGSDSGGQGQDEQGAKDPLLELGGDTEGVQPVTPLTASLMDEARKAGALGRPLLIGGQDIEDGSATLVVYRDHSGGERPVVFMKLLPAAEGKLMAALQQATGKMKKQVTVTEKQGRAEWDKKHQIAERLVTYAKSVNHHVGDGTPVPPHTLDGMKSLGEVLDELEKSDLPPGERTILEGYRKDYEEIAAAIQANQKTPRKDYGVRTGLVAETKEEWVAEPGALAYQVRPGSRLYAIEEKGVAYWDREERKVGSDYGQEIVIDFGDGWRAVYHPHGAEYKVEAWSYKGTLELMLPQGADPSGIPEHLERLYLQGQPMTKDEAEAVYLARNVWAMGLGRDPEVAETDKAFGEHRVDEIASEILFSLSPEALDGVNEEELLRKVRLAAERRAIREKVLAMRAVLEKKLGLPPGSLPKLPTYDPMPDWEPVHCPEQGIVADAQTPGGYFIWRRFDVDPKKLREMFKAKNRVIGHHFKGDVYANLKRIILGTGVLASQEVRWRTGSHALGSTMSPYSDMMTGGAAYAFLRVGRAGRFDIEWDPEILLVRSDWFWRPGDYYGATNPKAPQYSDNRETRPEVLAEKKSLSDANEIVFKYGISIFRYPPRRIRVPNSYRNEVLGWFKQLGVTHLGERPVEEVVVNRD